VRRSCHHAATSETFCEDFWDTATVVDATGGEVLTTDGPFAEAKEQMGGFWVISAPDLDAALKWAAEGSAACGGPVEVRPFQDEPGA
jgi:hypothetical protein